MWELTTRIVISMTGVAVGIKLQILCQDMAVGSHVTLFAKNLGVKLIRGTHSTDH